MGYQSKATNWNMVILCFWVVFTGKYVSVGHAVKTWLPFLVLMSLMYVFVLGGHR